MQRPSRPAAGTPTLLANTVWRPKGRSPAKRHAVTRREYILYTSVTLPYVALPPWALATSTQRLPQLQVLHVGQAGQEYASIQQAVDAAAAGSKILIHPGKYQECLVVSKSITLAAAEQAGTVEVSVQTQQPYRHCLEVPLGSTDDAGQPLQVAVQGLNFRHYSKSVADNYCIFTQSGNLLLQACDITSRSGVGVCVQGAALQLDTCTVHECASHGCTIYGSLEGTVGRASMRASRIVGNRLNGVLVRDGGELDMRDCAVESNGRYGIQLQDCKAVVTMASLVNNGAAPAAVQLDSTDIDYRRFKGSNKLDGDIYLL